MSDAEVAVAVFLIKVASVQGKRRSKQVNSLFERKGKPDPVKFYFFAVLFLLLGIWAYHSHQRYVEESQLVNPATINVKLIEIDCYGQSGRQRPQMTKTYEYSPKQSGGTYKVYDSIEYASKTACEADLQNANAKFPRSEVWYDQSAPWNARWTLDEQSSTPILWVTAVFSGLFFLFGLLAHRKVKRG